MDSKYLEPFINELVMEMAEKRKENGIAPYVATENEVYLALRGLAEKALQSLIDDNLITVHQNINKIRCFTPQSLTSK